MKNLFLASLLAIAIAVPAFATPHTIEAPLRVMVLPLRPIGDVGTFGWIGDGIEQSLIARASRPGATILTAAPQPATPGAAVDPIVQAKAAGASSVVTGSFQILNGDVRLSGQVLDVNSGQSLGALSATGPIRDLFKLEDELSRQLDRVLPGNPGDGQLVSTAVPDTVDTYEPIYAPTPSGNYYSTPDDSFYPRYYTPDYYQAAYPGLGYDDYGYLPFFSGFYFGSGFGYGYHDRYGHYHGWDGHHYVDQGSPTRRPAGAGRSVASGSYSYGPGNYGRGFAPVGTTFGAQSYAPSGRSYGAVHQGFSVGHAGFEPAENFSTPVFGGYGPVATHGIGTPGAAMGGGFGGGGHLGGGGAGEGGGHR